MASSQDRPAFRTFVSRRHADTSRLQVIKVVISLVCAQTPKYPSFVLSLDVARTLRDQLASQIAQAESELDTAGVSA